MGNYPHSFFCIDFWVQMRLSLWEFKSNLNFGNDLEMEKKSDFLIRGLVDKLNIRFSFVDTTATVTEGILTHTTDPLSGLIFGKALTVGALVTPLLNEKENYSIKWDYEGMLDSIILEVNGKAEIRAIPKETMLMDRVDTNEELYGENGMVSMVKSQAGKILNSGLSPAGLLDVCDDISFFMATSDQIETEFVTANLFNPDPTAPVKIFGGMMIQALPGCDLEKFEVLRNNLKSGDVATILKDKETPVEKKLWKLIETFVGDGSTYSEINEKYGVSYEFSHSPVYKCPCSREKMQAAMTVMKNEELIEMFDANEEPKITCQFCKSSYTFKREDFDLN